MTRAILGNGWYQWNSGAWFGGGLGGIAWMAIAVLFLLANNQPTIAVTPALGFAIGLTALVTLWNYRTRIAPFRALMIQLGLLALVVPPVLITISTQANSSSLVTMNWPKSSWSVFAASMIVPALTLWFVLLERTAVKNTKHVDASDS